MAALRVCSAAGRWSRWRRSESARPPGAAGRDTGALRVGSAARGAAGRDGGAPRVCSAARGAAAREGGAPSSARRPGRCRSRDRCSESARPPGRCRQRNRRSESARPPAKPALRVLLGPPGALSPARPWRWFRARPGWGGARYCRGLRISVFDSVLKRMPCRFALDSLQSEFASHGLIDRGVANAGARTSAVGRSEWVWFSNSSGQLKARERVSKEAEKARAMRVS